MLEAQLERARKDNLALRRRLEAAAAGAGARANPALLRVAQDRVWARGRGAKVRTGLRPDCSHVQSGIGAGRLLWPPALQRVGSFLSRAHKHASDFQHCALLRMLLCLLA